MEIDPMPHKDPTSYSWITYAWVLVLATWGGVTHNIRKLRAGTISRFSISELVGDITISGFIGVLTFWMCEAAGFSELWTAFLVGITSHMGTRGLMALEDLAAKKIGVSAPPRKDGEND
jgi:hypothetical protein